MSAAPTTARRAAPELPSLAEIAARLGGEVGASEVLCPGPDHSEQDRSLSVKADGGAPDGFLVFSFAGDDPLRCRDYVRQKLGLPAFEVKNSHKSWTMISDH